ncbi:stalk domain-containing protein [Paenibacillus sp. LjRoot153]
MNSDNQMHNSMWKPFIVDGSTYVPLRLVSELLETDIQWDGENNSVILGKKVEGTPLGSPFKVLKGNDNINFEMRVLSGRMSTWRGRWNRNRSKDISLPTQPVMKHDCWLNIPRNVRQIRINYTSKYSRPPCGGLLYF